MRIKAYKWLGACAVVAGIAGGPSWVSAPTLAQSVTRSTPLVGDATHGKELYHGCEACHSIEENDIGPRHRGVFGRRAGSLPDYSYSPALKQSGVTWDQSTLDRWLINPSALVPGTKMFFMIGDAQSRADIIAYLKEQR
jgi:cytochrome c